MARTIRLYPDWDIDLGNTGIVHIPKPEKTLRHRDNHGWNRALLKGHRNRINAALKRGEWEALELRPSNVA